MVAGLCLGSVRAWQGKGQEGFLDLEGEQSFWLSIRKDSEMREGQLGDTVIPNSSNTKENSWSWDWKKGAKSFRALALGS